MRIASLEDKVGHPQLMAQLAAFYVGCGSTTTGLVMASGFKEERLRYNRLCVIVGDELQM
jgi:hypothetical protein